MNRKLFVSLVAATLALSPVAATAADDAAAPLTVQQSTKKGTVSGGRAAQVTAKVVAIDVPNRLIELEGKNETDIIKVGPEVKNFDQIKAGDLVVVTFSQGVVLSMLAPDAKAVEPSVTVSGDTAAPGQKPSADAKATLKGTVTVTKIDMKTRIVTITGPEGRNFKVKAGKSIPLEKVKVGDKLVAEYTETVAVSVEPAPQKKPAKKAATK